MNGKLAVSVLAIFCLFGMTFAGFGVEKEMEGEREELPLEVRADFMQAMHEGDYDAAVELHEEYGIGGKKMEHATPEMFELRGEIFSAKVAGDWLEAVTLQDTLRELVKETVQAHIQERNEECKAFMENEEVQELMKEAHEAMESGDKEKAKEIREELKEILPEECAKPGMRMHKRERGMERPVVE
ncbi:MAG: hypothetical protein GY852_07680 [bacterium]|nr:hypothetical protein [bacterium]